MSEPMLTLITPAQCREARALLRWSRDRLRSHAEVSIEIMRKFDVETVIPKEHRITQIRVALEAAGKIFANPDSDGPGIRLRKDLGLET